MLIALSGKIGSGKNLFANFLVAAIHTSKNPGTDPDFTGKIDITNPSLYNGVKKMNSIQIHKFTNALKDIVCRLTGCTREQLEDQDFKNSVMGEEWNYTMSDARKFYLYMDDDKIHKEGAYTLADEEIVEALNAIDFKWKRTYREFLQELGTNILPNWIPNIHVNATFAAWKSMLVPVKSAKITGWGGKVGELKAETEQWPKWIITDMRFPNEAVGVKERGGIVIRINRYPKTVLVYRAGMVVADEIPFDSTNKQHIDLWKGECMRGHESETALDDYQEWDAVIDNNGTIEELYQQAIKIVKQFKLT